MPVKEYSSEEIFTRVQNNILRWGLKDYQLSIETTTRGGFLSWATVASEMVCSESYDLVIAELPETEHLQPSLANATIQQDARVDDEDRWTITGKKLDRFVDGEKSRSTGPTRALHARSLGTARHPGISHGEGTVARLFS